MTNEEAKKMLKAKLECFKNETSGINYDCNMRLCDGCSLNYEQGNMGEQKEALQMAIEALKAKSEIENSKSEIKNAKTEISMSKSKMTNEEARAYFIDSNERIISVAKDENKYNYETQQIEDAFMRRGFEANELAIKALEQTGRMRDDE